MAVNSKLSRSAGYRLRKFNITAFVPLLFGLALASLRAQEPSVAMKIDLVAWGDNITGLSLKAGQSKGGVTALAFRYSKPLDYSGPAIMEIYKSGGEESTHAVAPSAEDLAHELKPLVADDSNDGPGKDAKPKQGLALELAKRREKQPTLVALAPLPASGCRRATILLAPADEGTFIAYVIDDDPGKLPLGKLRIHNLCPFEISVRCNGSLTKELKVRESFIAPAKNQQLIYEIAYKSGDKWKMQENNIIPVRETEQTQMILLRSTNGFFQSSDGAVGGFLQIVTLRRGS